MLSGQLRVAALRVGLACAAAVAWAMVAPGAVQAAITDPAVSNTASALRGDPVKGEEVYSRCAACHALTYDRTGPRHCGLLGRRAGTVAGFDYSKAMKDSGIVWTPATLDAFLVDPMKDVSGTSMGYAGVKDSRDRANLIAYLVKADASAQCQK